MLGGMLRQARLATALVGLIILAGLGGPAVAQDAVPIITPSEITTPTSTPLALPTPTPVLPAAPAPLVQDDVTATIEPPTNFSARSIHLATDTPLTYTVRAGDTLFSVALEIGIDLADVPCAVGPSFTVDQPLVIGDVLSAPPANVVCHEVQAGDTIDTIAANYRVAAERIRALPWNGLIGQGEVALRPHTHLRVPLASLSGTAAQPLANGVISDSDFLAMMLNLPVDTSPFVVFGERSAVRQPADTAIGPVPADWPYGSGHFAWPVYGWLSQGYRYDHRAIDIAAPQGTPVTAADRGVVLRAGWNNQGYGRFVIIDHKIDYVTLYAHLDRVLVQEGEVVGQGQVIGTVGSTGNSTGPHLHFEIRDFGRLANPLEMLAAP